MSLLQVSIAAASAVLNADLIADTVGQQSRQNRNMVAVGLAGSAAALDSKVDIFVDDIKVGELFNSSTGAVTRDDMYRMGASVPAGSRCHAFVTDAAASNPLNLSIDFQDL